MRSQAAPASSIAPSPGQVLAGQWELGEPLGAGGMGEVWSARHVGLGRPVAVKLLISLSAASRARLLREARTLAGLQHPSIVRVIDVGEHGGTPFVVMERIDGESLAQRLGRAGPVPALTAARLFLPLLDGLERVHETGALHRDVKPDNVLVARGAGEERLVLIDFGIATAPGLGERVTATGALVGTPEYMAPEVLRGGAASARSDVWSVALTLLEALAGWSPFRRADFVSTIQAVVDDAPFSWVAPLDPGLRSVLSRALSKDPTSRTPSARALADDLEAWLGTASRQPPTCPPPAGPSGSSTWPSASLPAPVEAASASLDDLIRSRFGS